MDRQVSKKVKSADFFGTKVKVLDRYLTKVMYYVIFMELHSNGGTDVDRH